MVMTILNVSLATLLAAAAGPVWAQHDAHATPASQPGAAAPEQLTACVQSQRLLTGLVDASQRRLEVARQSNDASAMRAAVDDLQTLLSAMKGQLASCAELATAATPDPHAAHGAATPQAGTAAPSGTPAMAPGSTKPAAGAAGGVLPRSPAKVAPGAPAATDPHAGHVMPAPSGTAATPASRPASGAAKPPASKPAAPPAAGDPHGAHANDASPEAAAKQPEAQVGLVEDPVSKAKVDPKTSLRVLYQGKMYYFRSDKERQEFMRNPEKYASSK